MKAKRFLRKYLGQNKKFGPNIWAKILFFAKITPVVLKKYNLKDKKYIGKPFQITYTMDLEKEVDDEGNSFEIIVRSITELKQL